MTYIIEYFDLFYPAKLFKPITKKTNQRAEILYSSENPLNFLLDWVKLNLLDFYEFIIVLLFMYIYGLPSERYYFSTNILWQTFVSAVISRDRFSRINAYLLVANPTTEKNSENKLAKT